MLSQPQTAGSKNIIKFSMNHKIIKLAPRKSLLMPILSLQNQSQLIYGGIKSQKFIDSKMNASINFKKMLKIIDSIQNLPSKSQSQYLKISVKSKNYVKKQMTKNKVESSLIMSKNMLQNSIRQTINRYKLKNSKELNDSQLKIFPSKIKHSFVRFRSLNSQQKQFHSRSQYHNNKFLNWSSFCASVPGKTNINQGAFSRQLKISKRYTSRLSGSRSVDQLNQKLVEQELKGWGDTSCKLKIEPDEGFCLTQQ